MAPSIESSTGTSRQPSTRRPSSADDLLDERDRPVCVGVGRSGRNARPTPYATRRRQVEVDDRAEEAVGDLDQDAGAVAGVGLGARRAAVLEVAERADAHRHDLVAGPALDVDDERDAAGVVLEGGS